jgi:hypothetical protein
MLLIISGPLLGYLYYLFEKYIEPGNLLEDKQRLSVGELINAKFSVFM